MDCSASIGAISSVMVDIFVLKCCVLLEVVGCCRLLCGRRAVLILRSNDSANSYCHVNFHIVTFIFPNTPRRCHAIKNRRDVRQKIRCHCKSLYNFFINSKKINGKKSFNLSLVSFSEAHYKHEIGYSHYSYKRHPICTNLKRR